MITQLFRNILESLRQRRQQEISRLNAEIAEIDHAIDEIKDRVAKAKEQIQRGVGLGEVQYSIENACAYQALMLPYYLEQRRPLALRIQELERKLA